MPTLDLERQSMLGVGLGKNKPDVILICPHCTVQVPASRLERHVRQDLNYLAYHCSACRFYFATADDAQAHAAHSRLHEAGTRPRLVEELDLRLEEQVTAALASALPAPTSSLPAYHTFASALSAHNSLPDPDSSLASRPSSNESNPYRPAEHMAADGIKMDEDISPEEVIGVPDPIELDSGASDEERRRRPTLPSPSFRPPRPASRASGLLKTTKKAETECRLCHSKMMVQNQMEHVSTRHLNKPTFACLHCDFTTSSWYNKNVINKHHKREHPQEPFKSMEDRRSGLQAEITLLRAQCFEDFSPTSEPEKSEQYPKPSLKRKAPNSDSTEESPIDDEEADESNVKDEEGAGAKSCSECGVMVKNKRRANEHVIQQHIKQPRSECLDCVYAPLTWSQVHVRKHVQKKHSVSVEDSSSHMKDNYKELRPRLKEELFRLFGMTLGDPVGANAHM